jgi:hypothetical protein
MPMKKEAYLAHAPFLKECLLLQSNPKSTKPTTKLNKSKGKI